MLKAEKDPLLLKSIDNVIKCLENSSSHILILWLKQMTVRWIIKKFSEKESLSNLQLIIMSGPQGNFRSADWAENISFPNNSNLMQGLIQIYQVKPDTQLNRDKYHRCIERLRPESHPFVARIWENIFRCNIPDEFFPQGNESHNDLGIPKNNGKYSKTCDMRGNQKLTDVMRKSNRAAFSYLTLESIVKAVDDDGYIRTKSGKQLHQFQSNYQSSTKFYYRQYQPGDDLGKQKKLDRAAIRFNYNFKLHQNKIPEYLHNNFSTTYKNNYHGVCFGLLERDGIWIDPSKLSFSPNGISWRSAYKLKKNSRLTLLSLNILLGVVLLCCLMIHIIFYVYRKEKVVRRTGIYLSHLILLGIELCLISQSIWSLEWNTGYICSIKVCMLALGTGLTVGSVVARFMRLHLIFNRLIKFNRNPRVSSPNKYNKNRSKKCRIKQDASERQTNSNLSLDSKEFESQETELDIFSDSISNNYKPANSVEARHSKSILNQIHRPVKFTTGLIKKLPLMETSKIHLHNAIVINDLYLITRIILPIILIECILVSMLFGLPFKFRWPTPKVYDYHTVSEAVIHCYGCDESYEFLAVIALYVFNGALAFAALYLSYLTRNISMEFNEAIGLAMISYFYFLCALLFFPLYISMYMRSEPAQEQVNRQLTLSRAGGIFICALVTILILFIPKVGYILVNRNKFVRFIIRRPLRLFFASKNAEMKAPTNSIEDEDSDISVIKLNITDDALTESESHGKLKVPKDRLISLSSTGSSTLEDVLSEFGIDESFSSTQSAGLE